MIFDSLLGSLFSSTTNLITNSIGLPNLGTLGLSFSKLKKLFSNQDVDETTTIKDISLQTSTYSKVIPEIFGQMRIAGNIIWSTNITTTSIYHPEKIHLFSATESAYTEYYVRRSFAIAICKGKVDAIKNIYANDEAINISSYNIKIYLGDEEQQQDPTMKKYLGDDVPAFRGLCYVVFDNFPLENFNNSMPNFTFDIVRNNETRENNDMENLVHSMIIIPGSGEFVYDTKTQKKQQGGYIMGEFYETSKATIINNHSSTPNTDAIDSLNDLCNTFKNIEYVSLVVNWFCDSIDCKNANIYPACEYNNALTVNEEWSVAGIDRLNARVIGTDKEGNIRYGGTPSDNSIIRYVKEIKKRGLKVCIYPMLMCDLEGKPWRGHITGNYDKVHDFFTKSNGYNNFVKHYVSLLKDDIDTIIIASEFKGLTQIKDNNNNYPAVDELCSLAREIKTMVKKNTIITYAADWSEYHHDDNGYYNLDKLWSCEAIDVIGIDAYFPLTDETKTIYDKEVIKNGWKSGEGYDFYYSDTARTHKEPLSKEWAWKNIEFFWKNYHYNLDGTKTSWIPKSKKIWFTEYGFPSVDCCTNQPNVFYDKNSIDSALPRYSQGSIDFKAQRVAITATEECFKNSEFVERLFLYTWDARPYPYFPNLKDVWSDYGAWKYGHFLNGKSGQTTLANIINYLCKKLGLKEDEFDTTQLHNEIFQGYLIDDKKSVISHLKILANAFNFDTYVDDGKLCFKSLSNANTHQISPDDLIIENNEPSLIVETTSNSSIPSSIELLFIDIENNYKTSTAIANDNSRNTSSYSISVQMPLSISQAQEIAWRILSNTETQTTSYTLKLPISKFDINPLDLISIEQNGIKHLIRVKNISIINNTIIKIIGISTIANDNILSALNYSNILHSTNENNKKNNSYIAETNLELFELHNIKNNANTDTFSIHCAVWSNDENWQGCNLYYSREKDNNYQLISYISNESCIGKLVSINRDNQAFNINENIVDYTTKIEIVLTNEKDKLSSISDSDFSQMKNLILIGSEVIAFKNVEKMSNNHFCISHLLRGRFNTENKITNHNIGERVILLDSDIYTINMPITEKNRPIYIKAVSINNTIQNTDAKYLTTKGLDINNFETKNLDKKMLKNGDILLSFSARTNYKIIGNDTLLSSLNNIYIYNAKTDKIVRQIILENKRKVIYTTSMQKNDFNKTILLDDFYFKVNNITKIGK